MTSKVDEAVEAHIIEWVALFDEAEARAYWISLSSRQMDTAMRMLKVGHPIERPVQIELTKLYHIYRNYYSDAMGFACYIHNMTFRWRTTTSVNTRYYRSERLWISL